MLTPPERLFRERLPYAKVILAICLPISKELYGWEADFAQKPKSQTMSIICQGFWFNQLQQYNTW